MSEFHILSIDITDQKNLVKTLEEMGYKPKIHKEAQSLHGYQGDVRKQKAHVIIPRKQVGSASNDIGFELKDSKYIMHISEYDINTKKFNSKKLKQVYAKNKIISAVNTNSKYGLISQKTKKDGRIVMRVRVY